MALWQPRTLPCSPPHSLLAVAPRSPRPFPPRRVPPRAKPRGEAASWVSDPCTSHSHGGRFAGGVEGERRAMRLRFNKGPPREASSAGATTKKQARKQARLGFLGGLWFLAVVSRGWGFCVVSAKWDKSEKGGLVRACYDVLCSFIADWSVSPRTSLMASHNKRN